MLNLPLPLTFNKTSPNIKKVIDQHWDIVSINENWRKVSDKRPVIAYWRNTNLYQLLGGNRIFKNKVVPRNTKQQKQSGHCSPCFSRMNNLCCKQVKQTKTFQIYRTNIHIFHNLTCKSENLIYLLQCRICQIQYDGKSETTFNIRLNNHRKDPKSQASFLACKHFNEENHSFQQHDKFTLIEQIKKQPLKKQEYFQKEQKISGF